MAIGLAVTKQLADKSVINALFGVSLHISLSKFCEKKNQSSDIRFKAL